MTTKEIIAAIEEAQSLKQITQAFTQIASSKLKRIRAGAEQNKTFFNDLSEIYGLINIIANKRKIPRPVKNGKTMTILLTSNERFYGKITSELLEFYLVQVSKIRADKVVIGKSGVETLKSINYALTYTPMILAADFPSNAEFVKISALVKDYSKVLVFHPQFSSVMLQKPVISDITRSEEDVNVKSADTKSLVDQYNSFIVEPEIKIMSNFFDDQIKVLLLEATFLEAELARTASRLVSMDSAQNEAEKYLSVQQLSLINAQRSIQNARILETIAAMHKK
jgi:F0F1-type ATP synthase gamma subunit